MLLQHIINIINKYNRIYLYIYYNIAKLMGNLVLIYGYIYI